ncbi:MAG: ATP-binding protein [Myxococcales bacterium]
MEEAVSSTPSAVTPGERLLVAQQARRRMFVREVSALLGALSVLANVQMVVLGAPRSTIVVSVVSIAGYLLAHLLAKRSGDWYASAVMLTTMLAQHWTSALTVLELSEASNTIMFSGIIPLIAAATLNLQGTIMASVCTVLAIPLLLFARISQGADATLAARALGAPLFFALLGAVAGISSALAERRSMRQQLEGARAASEAQAAAAAAERRFRLVADQVSDLVAVLDSKGRHTFVSASYERILGISPAELTDKAAPWLLHAEDREAAGKAFREALQGQAREVVARLRSKEGTYRTFHLRMLGVQIDDQRLVAITSRDITDLQALSAELEAVRRMDALGRLAGGVAHDFNNLLAVIGSCASMLRSQIPSQQRGQRDLQIIDDAVQKAALLTGQLLSFARRQVLPEGYTAPAKVIRDLEPLLSRAVGQSIRLSLDTSGSVWHAQLSTGALEQIIMNLAVNARDAMAEGGRLHVRVSDRQIATSEVADLQAGEHIVIEVADTGSGIDPDVKSRIFEPFFTTKAAGKGTGLGLSTSFGVARQVGGTLTVDSAPGEGSTFRVYLPRAADLPQRKPEYIANTSSTAQGRTVLVVDDEERIRELIARLLEMAGHRVVTAANASQAITAAEKQPFDTMLVDIVLGSDDELDAVGRLREMQARAHFVVMSGYSPSPSRLSALRDTGIDFLAKPFAVGSLLRVVAPNGPTEIPAQAEDEA